MLSLIGFLVILAPLVVVHEFGHFFFARLFNVKAEAFSVGFGPVIWSRKFGETDFRLSVIPLGGYVKLLGEDPEVELSEADKKRALHNQTKWKRFFIFFGGPLFNFLFAILIYMSILVIGEPQTASVVGRVVQNSIAEQAGFRGGDKILSVDGTPVRFFTDVLHNVHDKPNQPISFEVVHLNQTNPTTITVKSSSDEGYSMYGEPKEVGYIDGIFAQPRGLKLGVSNPESEISKKGVQTGDELASFNGETVNSWEHFLSLYQLAAPEESIELSISKSNGEKKNISILKPKKSLNPESDLGLFSSELFIERVIKGSPAEKAKLTTGDRVIAIDDQPIFSFFAMKELIQSGAEKNGSVKISIEREGKKVIESIVPNESTERDPTLKKVKQFTIGVVPMFVMSEPVTIIERVFNPFVLLFEGTKRMLVLSYRNLVSLGKMLKGDVSVGTLGGPILIGKIAGDSLSRGLISFLSTMAVLSVGLGILNVLPVPVLDGGHILLLGVEAVRRKKLSIEQMQTVQKVGLSLILILMVVVIKNDIMRLPLFN